MTDELPFTLPDPDPTRPEHPSRKCYRHDWAQGYHDEVATCRRCGAVRDPEKARRGRNNGRRGRSDELKVARILGANKLGQLGLPWAVEIPGYLRAQCKQLDSWPSVNQILEWLDAIPAGHELRAVTLADTPGAGGRTRRVIVMDLEEYARWHGKA